MKRTRRTLSALPKNVFASLLFSAFLVPATTNAQLYVGPETSSLYIAANETFSFDGLSLTPTSSYTFPSTTITRTNDWTISPAPVSPYLKKYYSFSTTMTGFTGTVQVDHSDVTPKEGSGSVSMASTNNADLRVNLRTDASTWTVPTSGTITSTTVSATLSSGSLNTVAVALTAQPLPVSLLSFSGKIQSNGVSLEWTTANEQNSSHFDVERSGNGTAFNKVGQVAAAGNSSSRRNYNYLDGTPLPKQSWYRLKAVDVDGKSSYSQILPISRDAKISSYPNPVSNQLQLQLSPDWNGTYELVVFDLNGRSVMNTQVKAGSHMFDCSNWASGIYNVVMYQDNQQVYAQKIVKR